MSAVLIDGKQIASDITNKVAYDVKSLAFKPCLVVIQVGDDPASKIYVSRKTEACKKCDIGSWYQQFPSAEVTTELLIKQIHKFNQSNTFSGILVQLPLPDHIDKFAVLNSINPTKDVDCFTSHNLGLLAQNKAIIKPCTPSGIVELLERYNISVVGKHVVIINHSLVVGQPLATMLINMGATVTVCHSKTQDLPSHTRSADILVTAVGKRPNFCVTKEIVKPGAIVVDVGINRDGKKITGDAENDVQDVASYITPVPGSVGPMTVSMLMKNTFLAAQFQQTNTNL